MEKLKSLSLSRTSSSDVSNETVLACVTRPAVYSLTDLLVMSDQLKSDRATAITHYCTRIPKWPLDSLLSLTSHVSFGKCHVLFFNLLL